MTAERTYCTALGCIFERNHPGDHSFALKAATPEPRQILADRLIAATVARERIAREFGDSSPEALEAQAAVLRAHAAVCAERPRLALVPRSANGSAVAPDYAADVDKLIALTRTAAQIETVGPSLFDHEGRCIAGSPRLMEAHADMQHARREMIATLTGLREMADERTPWPVVNRFCPECGDSHSLTTVDLSKLADLLGDVVSYLEPRAEAEVEGDPPRFIPNAEMRLLNECRVAIGSVELVQAIEPETACAHPEDCDDHHPCLACGIEAATRAEDRAEAANDDRRFERERGQS